MIAKLSLLDISQLDMIESKVNNVNSRLEQFLNSQNSLTQDPEREKKVNLFFCFCREVLLLFVNISK